ncbi:MAG: ligase-associated DNA damage response endonuclease PdeM [Paracoccaceae bacterium]|nr:MAG: ligase-associated DNA damage response endonuclease PdeM [Paracoccaceae bacterium]
MTGHPITLGPARLAALPSGAVWWAELRLLCLGDLHLGKSGRLARRGGTLLPPYETEETLARIDADIALTDPAQVVCLGDSFDDNAAEGELHEAHALWLMRMMAGRDWIWIAGNHDPGPVTLGGRHLAALRSGGLTFRHIADPACDTPEVSAHFHPRGRIAGQARPAFVTDGRRLILPAYGAYTGGMPADHAAIAGLMGAGARAVLTGAQALEFPLFPPARARAPRPAPARRIPR